MPNPNIAEAGKATRFGTGNNAGSQRLGYGKPGSFVYVLRRMLSQQIEGPITFETLLPPNSKPFDILAAKLIDQGINGKTDSARLKAIRRTSCLVDGPIPTRECPLTDSERLNAINNELQVLEQEISRLSATNSPHQSARLCEKVKMS